RARQLVGTLPRNHPAFREDQGQPWQLAPAVGGPHLQTTLQRRLAHSTGLRELRQVRIDRAYFTYADLDIRRPELRCNGLSLGIDQRAKARQLHQLYQQLYQAGAFALSTPAAQNPALLLLAAAAIVPRTDLQEKIEEILAAEWPAARAWINLEEMAFTPQ